MSDETKNKWASPRSFLVFGYALIFLTFGLAGSWAFTAMIDSAVVAPGNLALEGNRKTIQHLEGGLIEEILVREANVVQKGDVLVRLSDVQAKSDVEVLSLRLKITQAVQARLEAERVQAESISFPQHLLGEQPIVVRSAVTGQANLFENRKSILHSRVDILNSTIEQLDQQIEGLVVQQEAYKRRIEIQLEQLNRMRDGSKQGVVQTNRLAEKEEQYVEVGANLGSILTEIAKTRKSIGETKFEVLQVSQEYTERANTEMKDVRGEISELTERLKVARDILTRTEVRSPVSGFVHNLQIHTSGGVISPGSVLMDIVPENERLVINAQIGPLDIDNVTPGLETEVRFVAFASRNAPLILGKVDSVSRDIITPQDPNQQPYFLARIIVEKEMVPEEMAGRLSPGMPSDVMIVTGERTVVDYLVAPLEAAVRKSLREE